VQRYRPGEITGRHYAVTDEIILRELGQGYLLARLLYKLVLTKSEIIRNVKIDIFSETWSRGH